MQLTFSDRLELFYGETTAAGARVYAQLPLDESTAGFQLGGSIYGPVCPYARTLPARFQFVDAGPGRTVLAQAVIQETCFWSPDMPYLYTATVELRRDGQIVAQVERPVGVRLLTAQDGGLQLEREPFALRGVYRTELSLAELPELHEAGSAVLISQPSDEICREASRCGVLLLALVPRGAEQVEGELRRLSRWPAVGIVTLDGDSPVETPLRAAARNVLLAQWTRPGNTTIAPWAELLVVEGDVTDRSTLPRIANELPIVVWSGTSIRLG